jgi:hypothetical protein
MNRLQIRNHVRFLINELTEPPEGIIDNDDTAVHNLNDQINLSIHNVQMKLIRFMPWYFRKTFNISTTINTRTYTFTTLGVTDFLAMEDIYYNDSGDPATPLLFIEPDQMADDTIAQIIGQSLNVGDTGEPKVWMFENRTTLAFEPTPDATVTSKFKAFYFYRIPDLTHDTSDTSPYIATPSLPVEAHPLISFDAVEEILIADDRATAEIEKRANKVMANVMNLYAMRTATQTMQRSSLQMKIYR